MAKVTLKSITKTFDSNTKPVENSSSKQKGREIIRPVLSNIDLSVDDGEFMVLVGPSGCGKSTLLRLISGLETLTNGDILVGDRLVNALPPKQRDIAMVFQSYALYPHLSVYNNLAFGLRRSRPKPSKTQISKRIQSVANMLQIGDLLTRLPKQLSGGQKQRVALGRAMARDPQVFLMDEPLSNLDAKLRTETRAQIVSLQRKLGITTIYVTHDQTEAMTMGDRIAIMNQGQIQQVAPPLELYRHPANRFVAAFIGSPPMNFISVTAKLTANSDQPAQLVHPDFTVALTPRWKSAIAPYANQIITLGIRPEHIATGQAPGAMPITVTQIEALGSETYILATLPNSQTIQLRILADQPIQIGSILQVTFPTASIHLFDDATELAIRP